MKAKTLTSATVIARMKANNPISKEIAALAAATASPIGKKGKRKGNSRSRNSGRSSPLC